MGFAFVVRLFRVDRFCYHCSKLFCRWQAVSSVLHFSRLKPRSLRLAVMVGRSSQNQVPTTRHRGQQIRSYSPRHVVEAAKQLKVSTARCGAPTSRHWISVRRRSSCRSGHNQARMACRGNLIHQLVCSTTRREDCFMTKSANHKTYVQFPVSRHIG